MGCWGSAVGSRADMVKERAVGDRTKSCMYRQYGTLVYIWKSTHLDCPARSAPLPPDAHLDHPY